jgi:F-type H+-transporting ATPase subunit c
MMEGPFLVKAAAYIGAAVAIAIGTIGPATGQGLIGSKAIESMGKYPEMSNKIRLSMLIAMGIVETAGVFAFVIAIMLILFNK